MYQKDNLEQRMDENRDRNQQIYEITNLFGKKESEEKKNGKTGKNKQIFQ